MGCLSHGLRHLLQGGIAPLAHGSSQPQHGLSRFLLVIAHDAFIAPGQLQGLGVASLLAEQGHQQAQRVLIAGVGQHIRMQQAQRLRDPACLAIPVGQPVQAMAIFSLQASAPRRGPFAGRVQGRNSP